MSGLHEGPRSGSGLADQLRFLRNWAHRPLKVGALSPSGPDLARRMAAFVDLSGDGPVVELGPGTGPVTKALLEHGVPATRLVAIEYSEDFVTLLRGKYPAARILRGDAYAMDDTLKGIVDQPLNAVVSSLPLLTRPLAERRALLAKAFAMLRPGGPFIQFSYGLQPPIPHDPAAYSLDITGWIVRNMPPARVFVYRKAG